MQLEDILKKIFSSNSRLYAEIITRNPHIHKVLEGYMESLSELKEWIDRKDGENVQKRIDRTKLDGLVKNHQRNGTAKSSSRPPEAF